MNKLQKSAKAPDKGGAAEEALREYFRQSGAFVIRGVPVNQGRDEITDVDLWVYTRASVHARHITIIDIKNKKKAKGYERVIWIKGLQSLLRASEAVIASTSGREELKPFADRVGVRVFSPQIYQAILTRYSKPSARLTSEELDDLWRFERSKEYSNLCARMKNNFTQVGLGLSFSSLNHWLDEAGHLLTWSLDHEKNGGPFFRAALMCGALVAIGADFLSKELAFSDQDARRDFFKSGLVFGRTEKDASTTYLRFAEQAVTDFVDSTGASAATIRMGFNQAVKNLPVNQFVEFFARPTAGRELMEAAFRLEEAAFGREAPSWNSLPTEAKTILGLVADYADLDRRRLTGAKSWSRDEKRSLDSDHERNPENNGGSKVAENKEDATDRLL